MSTKLSPRTVSLIFADFGVVFVAIVLALFLRLGFSGTVHQINENLILPKVAGAALICLLALYLYDLYDYALVHNRRELLIRLFKALSTAWLFVVILFFLFPPTRIGRGTLLYSAILSVLLLLLSRASIHLLTGHPEVGEKILILGVGKAAVETANVVFKQRDAGHRIVGFVAIEGAENGESPRSSEELGNAPILGRADQIEQIVSDRKVDRIVVALAQRRGYFPTESLLRMSLENRVSIEECASFFERVTGEVHLDMLRPSWLIFSGREKEAKLMSLIRDVFNRLLALVGIVLATPIALVTALAILIESKGDVFYRQERVGKNGRPFNLIKFRSMQMDAEADGKPVWASTGDCRTTRVGKFIRKVRIDEIPQFWNILKGEMSFIGPRPERPHFVAELARRIPFYDHRHLVAPGLTGWAQIKFPYASSFDDSRKKLQYDLFYIKNQSLALDIIIIFETIKTVIFGKGGR